MRDRNVEYPSRFRLVKVRGTDDIYDLEATPGDVIEEGTPLSKFTLLSDAVAARIGLQQDDPTVNDALGMLANVANTNLHAEILSYVGTGVSGQDNPCSLNCDRPIVYVKYLGRTDYNGGSFEDNSDVVVRADAFVDVLTTEYASGVGFSISPDVTGTFYMKKSEDEKVLSPHPRSLLVFSVWVALSPQ